MLKRYLDRPVSATRPIIRVYIARDDRGVSLREGIDKNHNLRREFLQDVIPGFIPGKVQALAVVIHRKNELLKSYHLYNGGQASDLRFLRNMPVEETYFLSRSTFYLWSRSSRAFRDSR